MKWVTRLAVGLSLAGCRSLNAADEPVIQVEVILPRVSVTRGEPVGLTLRITNPSSQEVLVETGCGGLFRVLDGAGKAVYPFPATGGGPVACISPDEPLAPGTSVTKRLVWPTHLVSPTQTNGVVIFVDPGVYSIRAAVRQSLTAHDVESDPQTVTITPPTG